MKLSHLLWRWVLGSLVVISGACAATHDSAADDDSVVVDLESDPRPERNEPKEADPASMPGATRTADINTLEFKTIIDAPVSRVWELMLSPEGYPEWTKPFMAGSYFEGSWAEGERMHFLAPGASGMVAVIEENRLHQRVSIKHIGYVMNGVEDTASEGVRSWAPAYEIYHFAEVPGGTEVRIEHEVLAGSEPYMQDVWPKALAALKELCEAS